MLNCSATCAADKLRERPSEKRALNPDCRLPSAKLTRCGRTTIASWTPRPGLAKNLRSPQQGRHSE